MNAPSKVWYAGLLSAWHTSYPTFGALLLLAYNLAGAQHVDPANPYSPSYNSSPTLWWAWWHLYWWPFVWTQLLIPTWRGFNTARVASKTSCS